MRRPTADIHHAPQVEQGFEWMTARVEALHRYPVKGMRGHGCDRAEVALYGLAGDRRWVVVDPDGRFLTQRQLADLARFDATLHPDGLELRQDGGVPFRVPTPGTDAPALSVSIWNDIVPALLADGAASDWLSARLDRPCRLAYLADPRLRPVEPPFAEPGDHVSFADGYPLLATSTSSLDALNQALTDPARDAPATQVPMDRFRPSVTITGFPSWSENRWRRIRIGAVTFRVPKPCARCVVITRDQQTGATPDPGEPLRTLARLNRHPSGIIFGANLIPDHLGNIAIGDEVEVLDGDA